MTFLPQESAAIEVLPEVERRIAVLYLQKETRSVAVSGCCNCTYACGAGGTIEVAVAEEIIYLIMIPVYLIILSANSPVRGGAILSLDSEGDEDYEERNLDFIARTGRYGYGCDDHRLHVSEANLFRLGGEVRKGPGPLR